MLRQDLSTMTSEPVYVWGWLSGQAEPVPVGVLEDVGSMVVFTYARSYLGRQAAVPLYGIPLRQGRNTPPGGMTVHGCFLDAAPDAWGRRVILHRLTGRAGRDTETADLTLFAYLLGSASDRAGALDFQTSPTEYVPRGTRASLDEMVDATERLLEGRPLSPDLEDALFHGTTIGGARPKVTLEDRGRHLIAKLSSTTDPYPVVKAEGVAMALAGYVGIEVPKVEMVRSVNRDVLLVERFDRVGDGGRRMMVSALTVLELTEELGRYATYYDFADHLRSQAVHPEQEERELFTRITFNIMVSNTDDHAKNHSCFWDGRNLSLTPAYDICPQLRSGGEQTQAMAVDRNGWRYSRLDGCVRAAHNYLLDKDEASGIIDKQLDVIETRWEEAADVAHLTRDERRQFWEQQILNPYILEGYKPLAYGPIAKLVGVKTDNQTSFSEDITCCYCRSKLTKEKSITLGYGPRCAREHGVPY